MKNPIILLALLMPISILGQQKVEVGGFAGFANYQGDLAPDAIEFSETKISFGFFARYHLNNKIKLRANGFFGFISGSDFNDNSGSLKSRGWSFESHIFECAAVCEYHPIGKNRHGVTGVFHRQISPYVFAGIGIVNSEPGITTARSVDAALFPEEGFKPTHPILPFGFGIRADLVEFASLGFEGGWRFTNTDYLDGVKYNANPDGRDLYVFIGATMSFFFGKTSALDF